MAIEDKKSAFSGGTKVEFKTNGTYRSNPIKKKFSDKDKRIFVIAFLGALAACIIVLIIALIIGACGKTTIGSTSSTAITQSDDSETLAEAVANKCLPSVVSINVYSQKTAGSEAQLSSLGSGVILSEDGYIITNQHVIEGAATIKATANGELKEATKVGEDASSDIAVIKLKDAKGLKPIELSDSDKIKIGEWVMAIGSPFGLEQSVSTGIVSAKSRSQVVSSQSDGSSKVYTNLIQTDAAINPGNSGGALVDKNGQLIGINALIQSNSGNYSGVGFAIPVNYAIDLAKQIMEGKTPSHAQLGVSITTVDQNAAKQYGWNVSGGAYINGVTNGGPADKAGLKVGNIITKVDDKDVATSNDLLLAIRGHNPGDKVEMQVYRDGHTDTVEVTLGSDEGQTQQKSTQKQKSGTNPNYEDLWKYFFGY
ncbi:MAG: trypsin-like peptidase domain-containing protein [Coriobacteriia bacterium]|nr:trypsin-like peptidase domain-containing protein [Coriobacteriia bacterium]